MTDLEKLEKTLIFLAGELYKATEDAACYYEYWTQTSNERDTLKKENEKLEAQILELSQAKKLDVPTMTDPAAKGEM